MIGVLSILIEPLAKALLKAWLGETASEIGGGLIKYARDVLRDSRKAADASRHVLAMATTLARDLETAMADEGLDEQIVEPAAAELAETIHRHFDTAIAVGVALDPQTLEHALLAARPIDTFYVPSEPEAAAYRHLVSLLAPRLCELAPDLPDYTRLRDSVLLARMAETARDATTILAKVGAMQQAVARFGGQIDQLAGSEQRRKLAYLASYRRAVREELDFVEILGLSELASHQREARLSVAYLSLTTSADDIGRLGTEELLDLLPLLGRRLLIEGPAGSGKSTLLRWAAVRAADSDEPPEERDPWQLWRCAVPEQAELSRELSLRDLLQIATGRLSLPDAKPAKGEGESLFRRMTFRTLLGRVWRQSIPFQIRLRHVRGGLPGPDLLPAHLSSALGAPPEHWVRDLLQAGHAMLLIDGVDEVPEGEPRQAAMAGIRSYAAQYPACLFVVASRPGACDVPLLRQLGFVQATIDELSENQRDAFIDNWHQAYASKRDRLPSNRETTRVAAALKALLANQPRLGRLATNPLLCAAICTLHERDRDALPRSEWDLCDKLTRMLAEQRDRSAGRQGSVGIDQFGPAYRLDYAIRRNVLSRLAEAMTAQQLSALPRDEAIEHVAETLSRSRTAEGLSAEEVLDALIARSGVLRASSVLASPESSTKTRDAVEFVHNTLKSWLASLHCLQQNKPRALAAEALVSGMEQVVVFAAGAPMHQAYAERLIEALLAAAAQATDPAQRRAIEVIALRCDAVAPELSPALHQRLASLADAHFPPSTFQEARALSALGDAAVARLKPSVVADAVAPALRCLRLVGTEAARQAMELYHDTRDPAALEELAQVFDPLLLPAVLDAVQNYQRFIALRPSLRERIHSLEALAPLKVTRNLWLSGTGVSDLSPLAGLSELRSLDLSHTRAAGLSALVSLPKLTTLSLLDTPTSLAPLAQSASLRQLSVGGDALASLVSLADLSRLEILIVLYSRVTSLEPLASLVSLKDLTIVQSQVSDLSPLTALPALTSLDLGSSPVTDLSPLARIRSLKSLRLSNLGIDRLDSLSPLTGLTTLSIPNLPVESLAPLADMRELERLDISGTRVETLRPIIALPNLRVVLAHKAQLSEDEVKRFTSAHPSRKVEQGR